MESGEVVVPTPALPPLNINKNTNWYDHNSSNCSTPYISAPSSPQRPINLFFYSAPPSPRASTLSHDGPPFGWETKPGVPKSLHTQHVTNSKEDYDEQEDQEEVDDGFEFEFSGQLDTKVRDSLSSADELFSGGKIRPLKPPPAAMITAVDSPKSPRSPMSKFCEALSPRHRKIKDNNDDPFEAALRKTASNLRTDSIKNNNVGTGSRGRSRNMKTNQRGQSRSLSPLRVSEFASLTNPNTNTDSSSSSSLSSSSGKKWRLRDFLLFRSASEGRATSKDPLRRFFTRKGGEEEGGSGRGEGSFRSSEGSGSVSRRRGGGQVSAHEMHYTVNRAVAEELKKKTSLPYKHGLLGCLGFHHGVNDLSNAFGSFAGKY